MFANSKPITSTQCDIHDGLAKLLTRHEETVYRRPIPARTVGALEHFLSHYPEHRPKLILDSGCGTGTSTLNLARSNPDSFVLGLDKSAARLSRGHDLPENALLMRVDVIDFWRLLHERSMTVDKHYLLYPNPWPKSKHLSRRWHGHPVFAQMLQLSPRLELRTNWEIYAKEFHFALTRYFPEHARLQQFTPSSPISAFERKYQESGHELFMVSFEKSNEEA